MMQLSTWLLCVPGASNTMLDVQIPYSRESLRELVQVDVPCASEDMAIELSKAAYRKSMQLSSFGASVMGVGVTCALTTGRERRGDDRAFVATFGPGNMARTHRLMFEKGRWSRMEQDCMASSLGLDAIATAMVLTNDLDSNDMVTSNSHTIVDGRNENERISSAVELLIQSKIQTIEFSGGRIHLDTPRSKKMYLPGSFNPLHKGHIELLEAAQRCFPSKEGAFELSIGNADKGMLSKPDIVQRVEQFISKGLPVVLTRAPLFTMKSELFPNSTFIVGYDTAVRLVQEKYYGSEIDMALDFANLGYNGCDFIVAGRLDKASGQYLTLSDIDIPESIARQTRFFSLSSDEFRMDISSTEIREMMNQE